MKVDEQDRWIFSSYIDRSFRNQADRDYITARMLFRAELYSNFLWPALQAIEKYLKAVLLFSLVPTYRYGHNVFDVLGSVKSLPGLGFVIPEEAESFVKYLGDHGQNRYLDFQFSLRGDELRKLDWTVWHIRRYCQDFLLMPGDEMRDRVLSIHALSRAVNANASRPWEFKLSSGLLEKVLEAGPSKMREALIWENPCYSARARTKRRVHTMFENPTHVMHPRLVRLLKELVRLPKDVIQDLERRAGEPPNQGLQRMPGGPAEA